MNWFLFLKGAFWLYMLNKCHKIAVQGLKAIHKSLICKRRVEPHFKMCGLIQE